MLTGSVQLASTVEDVRRPAVTGVLVDSAPVTMATVLATWDVLQGTPEHSVKMSAPKAFIVKDVHSHAVTTVLETDLYVIMSVILVTWAVIQDIRNAISKNGAGIVVRNAATGISLDGLSTSCVDQECHHVSETPVIQVSLDGLSTSCVDQECHHVSETPVIQASFDILSTSCVDQECHHVSETPVIQASFDILSTSCVDQICHQVTGVCSSCNESMIGDSCDTGQFRWFEYQLCGPSMSSRDGSL
ncbi:hypothetical protein RRG08_063110 [Elysia crispata]|uniref:Uncharacterized protein n=1 Tax=Elysia crispata TaxID=231223 RepID=A0AAE1CXZ7_9GAST|nr:hypothetical protein RRG08_063110 [Elysia crispata]